MAIPEKLLNDNGIFIEERPHRTLPGYTEDWICINGKEYQTSYASYEYKTLIIWDGEDVVTNDIFNSL